MSSNPFDPPGKSSISIAELEKSSPELPARTVAVVVVARLLARLCCLIIRRNLAE